MNNQTFNQNCVNRLCLPLVLGGVLFFWVYSIFVAAGIVLNNRTFTQLMLRHGKLDSQPFIRVTHQGLHASVDLSEVDRNILLANRTPMCIENLLNAQKYDFAKWATDFQFGNLLFSFDGSSSCRLLNYTAELSVKCIDILVNRKEKQKTGADEPDNRNNSETGGKTMLHFAFIGDSRIRQQFFSFLKLIPNNDWKMTPSCIPPFFHDKIEVVSALLQTRITFEWQPLLDHQVLTTIQQYLADKRLRPDWIILGMELHHLLEKNNATLPIYLNRMKEILPLLNQLGQHIKVIWLHQYPSIGDYSSGDPIYHSQIYPENVQMYNEAVRPIVKLYHHVHLWDSSNKLAEEYIRGCQLVKHWPSSGSYVDYTRTFMSNCDDFIHTANVALAEATQLLYNDLCNRHFVEENRL